MVGISTTGSGILTTTWAAKPSGYIGLARITDVGVNGSTWYSDGTKYSHEGEVVLSQPSTGWIVHAFLSANASTFSQAGTIVTVTSAAHGLTATQNGKSIYLIIGATGTWCTNFTYIDANTFTCTSPTSQTASGIIARNSAETTITPLTFNIFGGLMGGAGKLVIDGLVSLSNSANSKFIKAYYDTSAFYSQNTVSIASSSLLRTLKNKTATAQVTQIQSVAFPASSTTTTQHYSINSAIDKNVSFSAQLPASTNEFIIFEYMDIKVQS